MAQDDNEKPDAQTLKDLCEALETSEHHLGEYFNSRSADTRRYRMDLAAQEKDRARELAKRLLPNLTAPEDQASKIIARARDEYMAGKTDESYQRYQEALKDGLKAFNDVDNTISALCIRLPSV